MLQDLSAVPTADAGPALPILPLLLVVLGVALLVLGGLALYRRLLERPVAARRPIACGEHLIVMPGEVRKDGRARLELATTRTSASERDPALDISRIPRPTWAPKRVEIASPLPLFREADRARRAQPEVVHAHPETAGAEGY